MRTPDLGTLQHEATKERREAWMHHYGLRQSHVTTGGMFCYRPIFGKRCLLPSRFHCPADMPSQIADHGRYYRRPGDRHPLLFLGQPYDGRQDAAHHWLQEYLPDSLYYHIGEKGKGWYNTGTFPIIISHEPIPDHRYRCTPFDDSEEALKQQYLARFYHQV